MSIDNTTINKGSTNNVKIEIQPSEAKGEIVWSSSNENVLTVENGIITARGAGTATVTAQTLDGKVSDSIEITVYSKVESISLSKEKLKYEMRHLELVSNLPSETMLIAADGRRLWRVLENLYR